MHPPRPIGREPARGDDAVHVRMVQERLAPRVEDAEKADVTNNMLTSRYTASITSATATLSLRHSPQRDLRRVEAT